MPDTTLYYYPDRHCSDCGELGTSYRHWGDLVPVGETADLCVYCFAEREAASKRGEVPKPLGVKPPGVPQEFASRAIRATTEKGSIYELGPPNEKEERTISCATRILNISPCKVLCLTPGESMWFRGVNDGKNFWRTTKVVLIE